MRDGIFKPDNCFRLEGPGANEKATATKKGPDFLSGYTLELEPEGADVAWGSEVEWDEDPFEDLTCDSMTVNVADELDVCSMFEEEVADATEGAWTFAVNWNGTTNHAVMWTMGPKGGATAKRFSTLWFDDDLDGKIKNKNPERPPGAAGTSELHDLYDNNMSGADNANLEVVWQLMTNTDGSPNRGDFGKVDLVHPENVDGTG